MRGVIEWRANTTGNPKVLKDVATGTRYCHQRQCGGVMDYIYHCWWKCRQCARWGKV